MNVTFTDDTLEPLTGQGGQACSSGGRSQAGEGIGRVQHAAGPVHQGAPRGVGGPSVGQQLRPEGLALPIKQVGAAGEGGRRGEEVVS
jgi:hypothetical protein